MNTKKIDMKNEVNRALRAKKRFLMLTGALLCMLFVSESAWGTTYQYAALTASVNDSGAGEGTVYAALSVEDEENETWEEAANDPTSHDASSTATSPDGASKIFQFTAYATAARGSLFSTWESLGGDGSPALADGYSMTDNPIQVKVQAYTNTDETGTNTATIKATFAINPVAPWDVKFLPSTNGTYSVTGPAGYDTPITLSTETTHSTYNNDDLVLTATPNTGYVLYRYYGTDADGNTYTLGELGKNTQTVNLPEGTVSVCAEFTSDYFLAAGNTFNTLADAIQATRQNDGTYRGTILQMGDYTVPAGYYTIPAGVTLLIPVDANQVTPRTSIERVNENSKKPTKAYKTLTLASGVHLDVFGAIEVGGRQNCYNNNGQGRPQGDTYGVLDMKSGSTITLENGANLYAWGFVIGDRDGDGNYLCSIDARRGASVHEQFQMYDWEGGSETYTMEGNDKGVFVINEYFIQNVEVATTYRPGSALYTYCGILGNPVDGIKVVGVEGDNAAMFLMDDADDSEDTWVRKSYNPTTDQQVYEINNAAKLGNLEITFVYGFTIVVNSRDYVLPITHNMKIHLLTGQMDITQNTVLLPGAEIEVDKQATVTIANNMTLYLFDYHEWDAHIHQGKYAWRAEVRPGGIAAVRDISSAEGLGNAKLNVHGTFIANGLLITTESGADIYSNNADAGTIIFNISAPDETPSGKELYVHNYKTKDTQRYYTRPTCPALLRNSDSLYPTTSTAGTPAGQSYCYMNGKWTIMTVDPTNECFVKDNYNNYYAKPGAYVQLANGKTENADHTYSDANGQGRLYILMDECQWWEVELDNNLYKGITRDANDVASPNGKYYAYNNTSHKWEEKRYTITWKDWDGSVITSYQLTYGVTPKYLSTNPTRPADVDYTYNFTGWSPAITPVTGDQIYTATYSKEQIKYTIIFKFVDSYRNGAEIDRQQLARDEMPVIPTVTRAGWYLKWTPAVAAVTGNATYEATWLSEAPTKYEITFYDYDGTTVLKQGNVNVGDMPTAPTIVDGKPQKEDETFGGKPETSEFTYVFDHWSPAIDEAVSHTSPKSFTAVYREVDKTFAIRFFQEDGTTQIGKTQNLKMGAAVTLPDPLPTKSEAGKTFTLQWKNMANDQIVGTGVPAVSDNADYVADFSLYTVNRYTVSVQIKDESGNAVTGCAATGSGTYDHGTEVTINVTPAARFKYWGDEHENTNPQRTFTLTAAKNLTAICVPNKDVPVGETAELSSDETYYDFVISADENHSSQVVGANHVNIATGGHAYFDLTLNTQRRHWKAFTVPFEVDLRQHPILADGVSMPLGVQYDIIWYDGAVRAAKGKVPDCWKYVEDQTDWILTPGKAYLIVFGIDVNTVRFTKKDGVSVAYGGTVSVAANNGASDDVNGGWNGIGNPATYHAMLNAGVGVTTCQVHNGEEIGSDGYIACDMGKFIVGKAVFVQVAAEQTVVVNKADSDDPVIAPKPQSAPRRAKANATGKNRFDVQIAPVDGQMADRMFLLADEDKEDKYVILQDLAKAGLSTKRAQMWVERYNTKLCKNTAQLVNGTAEYPLGIYAPQAGEYQIAVAERMDEQTILYLTLDGGIIWNLNDAPYIAELEKGTTLRYGLKMVRSNAPAITTSVENTLAGTQPTAQKILMDGQVYILRGNEVYTIDGQLVK